MFTIALSKAGPVAWTWLDFTFISLSTLCPQVKLALVTRNTTASVDAFFDLVGEQWRSTFSLIRTREFNYVKPDKRLLVSVAQVR